MINIDVFTDIHSQFGFNQLHFNFAIEEKICTAIYGESGAGKTTLLRLIAGLSIPTSGSIQSSSTIYFDSHKKINLEIQKRNIGFLFQDYALFPNMTVKKNIYFAFKNKSECAENTSYINQLVSIMEIDNLMDKYPHEISGGQKQRVALARTLARKPKLLLLDEPLSALDNKIRLKLQTQLKILMETFSFTTVLVSHDLNEIQSLAKNVVVLKNGKVETISDAISFSTE